MVGDAIAQSLFAAKDMKLECVRIANDDMCDA